MNVKRMMNSVSCLAIFQCLFELHGLTNNPFLLFFFSVGGKLVNQHGIIPIVWAWLNRPTKNLPGFRTPPELLT